MTIRRETIICMCILVYSVWVEIFLILESCFMSERAVRYMTGFVRDKYRQFETV